MTTREQTIYLGIGGHAVALDPATGNELWRRRLKRLGASFTGLYAHGDRLFATAAGEIWCLDRTTGDTIWHEPLKGLGQGVVTLAFGTDDGAAGGRLLFLGIGGHVVALDWASGSERWRRKLRSLAGFSSVALTPAGLLASAVGEVWCLRPVSGEVLWQNRLKGLGQGFVAVAGNDAALAMAAHAAARRHAAAAAGAGG